MAGRFSGVKAIYFDLDDTLCGYWTAAKIGLNRTFADNPDHGRTVEQMLRHWSDEFTEFGATMGSSTWYPQYCKSGETTREELMRRVLERIGIYDLELVRRLSHTYYVERHAALELFPEAMEVLEALHGRFPLGLITNGPADIQRQEIETCQVEKFFDHIFIEGEMGFGKPNPEVTRRATEAMGVEPNEILMVGNSYKHDMVPAIEGGWRTAWIRKPTDVAPSSKTGKPEELPTGATAPDLIINDLRELLPELNLSSQTQPSALSARE